jgi:nucleoside phosphorylase
MIAVFFALPQESHDFIARLRPRTRVETPAGPLIRGRLGSTEVAVFHVGMGTPTACSRLIALARTGFAQQLEGIIAAGFAGGLAPKLRAGSLVLDAMERGVDPGNCWHSRARNILGKQAAVGKIATSSCVLETPKAKALFARMTGALAVEMENTAIVDFARGAGLPLIHLRAITDPANAVLPFPAGVGFDEAAQRPLPLALLAYLLTKPGLWWPFAKFVFNVGQAQRALAASVADLVRGMGMASGSGSAVH